MKKNKSILRRILGASSDDNGFTLIELISVLVILGILAAVAIPKYTSLQDSARDMSAQAAIAEMKARANAAYAKLVGDVVTGVTGAPASIDAIALTDVDGEVTALSAGAGDDYDATLAAGVITVTAVQGEALVANITDTWFLPQF